MATIRAYTTIEQGRKLAEILPLESSDMSWQQIYDENHMMSDYRVELIPYRLYSGIGVPCWSLAALLGVLPKGINISTPKPINELGYCCWNQYDEIYADNPIDACYEMIIKLHEQNLL